MSHIINNKIFSFPFLFLCFVLQSPVFPQSTGSIKDTESQTTNPLNSEESEIPFEKLLEDELNKETNPKSKANENSTNWALQIFKTIIGLGFIIFVIFLFKKYLIFKNSFNIRQTDIIKLLHEYPISTGKKMQLIEIGNKILLIGISDAGLNLISEFKEKSSIDQIKMSVENQPKIERPDFLIEASKIISNKIQQLLKGKKDFSNLENLNSRDWSEIQNNARNKLNDIREKKKELEEKDKFDDRLF